MTRREIFFIVSLACLGIFILIGAYLLGESRAQSKETAFNKESYTQQTEEMTNPAKVQPTNTAGAMTNPAATASPNTVSNPTVATNQPATANQGNVQSSTPKPALSVAGNSNISFAPGSKVGEIVKIGDVEMIVTKSTARHKVIDITLKGNTSDQPPRLVLTDNNRIVYEIPADVDVNVDVTEKTVVDKSPIFYGEQKAGQ